MTFPTVRKISGIISTATSSAKGATGTTSANGQTIFKFDAHQGIDNTD